MYTILIVEDEYPARRMLRMLIDGAEEYAVVGEAENGVKALELYHALKPDVILTDIEMPVMNGLELIEAVKKEDPSQAVIILSCYESFIYAQRAMHLGVRDYLIKDMTRREDMLRCLNETASRLCKSGASFLRLENDTFDNIRRLGAAFADSVDLALNDLFLSFFKRDIDSLISAVRRLYRLRLSGMLQYRFLQFINETLDAWIRHEAGHMSKLDEVLDSCSAAGPACDELCERLKKTLCAVYEAQGLSERMRNILIVIAENFDKDLSLNGLADRFYLHPVHLSRTFKTEMNMNISAYVNYLRIEKAKLMLYISNRRVNEVAEAVGFNNPQSFYNAFKKQTGVSPTEFGRDRTGD